LCLSIVALARLGMARADEPPPFAESRDDSASYRVETILTGLNNPASVAVRPGSEGAGTAELFVSESGAGVVLRVEVGQTSTPTPAVTGFPVAALADEPAFRVGPLGLAFLSRNRLAVGTGGLGNGKDLIRVYSVPDGAATQTYDQPDHSAGPLPAGGRSSTGEGSFWSLATTDRALFAAARSGDEQGWVLKATLDANRIAALEPFIATRTASGAASPAAVTVDPRPQRHYLVVAQRGAATADADSRLTMYSPTSGSVALNLNTGLRDIVALAYSPAPSLDLYAADYSQANSSEGGVYRLEAAQVDGHESCRAVKIAAVTRPTSLAFTADGAMFVTALGDPPNGDANAKPAGVLLKITPAGNSPKL